MESSDKFFGLGKTLAAGAFALAMLPAGALATATFDATGFAALSLDPLGEVSGIVYSGAAIDDDTAFTSAQPGGKAVATIDTDSVLALDGFTLQDAAVSGSADPSGGGSNAFASLTTSTSFEATNTTGGDLTVPFDLDYLATASTSLTDVLNEAVGAGVNIEFGTYAFDFNTGQFIETTLFQLVYSLTAPGILGDQDLYSDTVEIGAGETLGFYVDVDVDGQATSRNPPGGGVPVPATLALLGIGLIGLASRRRLQG